MNPSFPARLPFKMFNRVGDVDLLSLDPGFLESAIHHLSRRTDERLARQIFRVSRLLADQHHGRAFRPLAENGLGRVLIKRTSGASTRRFREDIETGGVRHWGGM